MQSRSSASGSKAESQSSQAGTETLTRLTLMQLQSTIAKGDGQSQILKGAAVDDEAAQESDAMTESTADTHSDSDMCPLDSSCSTDIDGTVFTAECHTEVDVARWRMVGTRISVALCDSDEDTIHVQHWQEVGRRLASALTLDDDELKGF
mmetsp:Transcript_47874/g.104154  ORF Transcript_47874/g.104154 Transcript_47874/m.104154 type:complete len:150 (-) Transcript_47874:337-786(-)|eukprot:CAMPEP_0170613664 /NCGR_PEP_ID=MMETSP0224-20130122/24395_1 /TAXON_ID=285029 /ORGANISM="Togula jolla, Strain CCCM 725" /LENGTH=149 /DNA_ID=CAMNT_0010939285 /DNA_START=122 /DNA_END=571 /DNA_ORIENTATION=+